MRTGCVGGVDAGGEAGMSTNAPVTGSPGAVDTAADALGTGSNALAAGCECAHALQAKAVAATALQAMFFSRVMGPLACLNRGAVLVRKLAVRETAAALLDDSIAMTMPLQSLSDDIEQYLGSHGALPSP